MGIIYTMNAPKEYYETALRPGLKGLEAVFQMLLKGQVRTYASCDTVQVKDYSKYSMGSFSEEAKKAHHDEQFPIDKAECFKMGAEMNK